MNDKLRLALHDLASEAPVLSQPPPSFRRAARRRRLRSLMTTVIVIAVFAGASLVGSRWFSRRISPTSVAVTTGTWGRLPPSPLSPRYAATVFAVGERVLVLGGTTTEPCPPTYDCNQANAQLRDGAMLDLRTHIWTRVATPPVLLEYPRGAVFGGRLYLLVPPVATTAPSRPVLLSYDPEDNTWETHPAPPHDANLLAAGSRIVAWQSTQERGQQPDLAYDPSSKAWAELPRDPLAPSFDRGAVWTGSHLVVFGKEVVPQPGLTKPAIFRAAAYDFATRTWRRFNDSKNSSTGSREWFWSGGLAVNVTTGMTQPYAGNPERHSYADGSFFNPSTGEWPPLPQPISTGSYRGPHAAGSRLVVYDGVILDVPARRWIRLDEPNAASENGAPLERAAAFVGDRLVVFGGYVREKSKARLLGDAWIWTPRLG